MRIEKIGRIVFWGACLAALLLPFAIDSQAQTLKRRHHTKKTYQPATRPKLSVKTAAPKPENVKIMPKTQALQTVAAGTWGAAGINLSVGENSSQIQFDCADAEITDSLQINSQGNFTANGYFVRGTHGPVSIDAAPKQNPARFTGVITGDSMNLKITLIESGEVIGEYILGKDTPGKIRRCY